MGVTVGTMESLLVRGRRHLRAALVEALLEPGRTGRQNAAPSPATLKAAIA
jgi:hypothetical protein